MILIFFQVYSGMGVEGTPNEVCGMLNKVSQKLTKPLSHESTFFPSKGA